MRQRAPSHVATPYLRVARSTRGRRRRDGVRARKGAVCVEGHVVVGGRPAVHHVALHVARVALVEAIEAVADLTLRVALGAGALQQVVGRMGKGWIAREWNGMNRTTPFHRPPMAAPPWRRGPTAPPRLSPRGGRWGSDAPAGP